MEESMLDDNKQLQDELGIQASINIDDQIFVDEYEISNELNELEYTKKSKTKETNYSLKARRAIEDRLENKKLHEEVDYLFDEHFGEEE